MFRFVQFEFPGELGPPDGRYLIRDGATEDRAPTHVLVLGTLGSRPRSRNVLARRRRAADPEPEPFPVTISRVTVVHARPGPAEAARDWLRGAGEEQLDEALGIVNRARHAQRLAAADPYLGPLRRSEALVSRVGYGAGEAVADGRWAAAVELDPPRARRRRAHVLEPQSRLAALLGGRARALLCEELALRARQDLEQGQDRAAAVGLSGAFDAALAELPGEAATIGLAERLAELEGLRPGVRAAAQAALRAQLAEEQQRELEPALVRLESALRARAAGLRGWRD